MTTLKAEVESKLLTYLNSKLPDLKGLKETEFYFMIRDILLILEKNINTWYLTGIAERNGHDEYLDGIEEWLTGIRYAIAIHRWINIEPDYSLDKYVYYLRDIIGKILIANGMNKQLLFIC